MMLLLWVLAPLTLLAQETPQAGKWYFLTFNNSGNVITSRGEGAQVTTNALMASNSQCWQLTGSDNEGYTISDRNGLALSVDASKSSRVKAGKNLTATVFKIVKVGAGYEIRPKANNSVAFNQFGGAKEGAEVGLWDAGNDPGNIILFSEARTSAEYKTLPRLIPWPRQITVDSLKTFDLTQVRRIVYDMPSASDFIEDFARRLTAAGLSVTTSQGTPTGAADEIGFTTTEQTDTNAYQLQVSADGIRISAGDRSGFFYALQTLKQLLPDTYFGGRDKSNQGWNVRLVDINDRPLLGHRGYMLDIARHFFSKQEVMRVLDIMAFYKMNRFHWHLTDDQGWRIEIPEYPKLTTVGNRRAGSFVNSAFGDSPAFFDDTPYGEGMFYTLKELREVVDYAAARGIEIIPEVDLPGHMVAALASYPELSCDSTKQYSVRIPGGISHDVLNIGDDRVIDFLKCVLRHVAETFPGKYIHIGGDECPTENWANNAQCLKRVKDEGLSGVEELQSWLVEELGIYLRDNYGKDIIVWDELLKHWKPSNTIKPVIMAWNSTSMTVNAANKGFKSIYVPYQQLYLDMMQVPEDKCDVNEIYQGGWGPGYVNSLPTVYNANALQAIQNSGKSTDFVLGMQGNMWTETTSDSIQLEYQLLPRLAGLAENAWLPATQKNWVSFYNRLQHHDEIYDALGYTYARHYIEDDSLSVMDAALKEAHEILDATEAGEAGYATREAAEALQTAITAAETKTQPTEADAQTLTDAIKAFKESDIVQPDSAAVYQVVSASTFYRRHYAGSSLYQTTGDNLHIHYTQQNEPEELWQFAQDGAGRYLVNLRTGRRVVMGNIGSAASFADAGTALRIDKATVANKQYTYVPGVVTISAVNGYSATRTGSVKRLVAVSENSNNVVKVQDEPQLCMPGTWKLVRVDDFSIMLKALVKKCSDIIRDNDTTRVGNYTTAAIAYITQNLITPAKAVTGIVSEEQYQLFMDVYSTFLTMPKTDNGPYATSFDRDAARTYSGRTLTNILLGSQTITNPATAKMYQNLTAQAFTAKAGERVTPKFTFSTGWMNGYVYIDRGSDGAYSASVNADGTISEGSDLMAYSFYSQSETSDSEGFNSAGTKLTGPSRNVINPPSFTVPELTDGFYMMRYKVDWNSIDPKGSTVSGNDIMKNGGDIIDIRLRIYSDSEVGVTSIATGGQVLTTAGEPIGGTMATIGRQLSFRVQPAEGHELTSLTVMHGILTGDSIVSGVAQRVRTSIDIHDGDTYTVPAMTVDGDLCIEAVFGVSTGISETIDPVSTTDDRLYDLQGRRVVRPSRHGIYIRSGKKVVF